jgi:TIGR00730 family protein
MRRICVFTGSNVGKRPAYERAAIEMGQALNARDLGLVYGGGRAGLMGVVADSVFSHGGEVIGVIPTHLFPREIANPNVTQLHEVGSMHERKALMEEVSDGFIALPGGFGTFDELFEILTWAQLGIHHKPVGLLNVEHYFDPLLALVEHCVVEGFVKPAHADLLIVKENPDALLDAFMAYVPPEDVEKWDDLPKA